MNNPFKGHRFNREIILFCVRWYLQTSLSYQQLSDMLSERGVSVHKTNIWRWVQKFAPEIKKRAYKYLKPTGHWHHVDETPIKVKGKLNYLYRAIDHAGNTVDFLLTTRKDTASAIRFFIHMFNQQHVKNPSKILVDKNPAYPAAIRLLKSFSILPNRSQLVQVNHANDLLEQDHRFTKLKVKHSMWFQSFNCAQNTIDGYETMHMIRKGQMRYVPKNNPTAQCNFVQKLFGVNL